MVSIPLAKNSKGAASIRVAAVIDGMTSCESSRPVYFEGTSRRNSEDGQEAARKETEGGVDPAS